MRTANIVQTPSHTRTRTVPNRPTNQLTFAIYLYRSSDLSAIIMYQMSILVRLIQMYFDSFALTVALYLYTWVLAIITVIAAAVPQQQQQQLMRQSFTFHLLDCNKTSLYCMRWSQSPQSTLTTLLSLYIKRQFYRFNEETMSIRHISTRPFHFAHIFMWFRPFVFVCSFAVCTNNMVYRWIQLYMLSNPLTLHTNININSSTRSRQIVMNKKTINGRRRSDRSTKWWRQRIREYKNIKR